MNIDVFVIGRRYDREQIADRLEMPGEHRKGGTWMTGYSRWDDSIYVFCNVGIPGRTGHEYANRWFGKDLVWYGKTGTTSDQPMIRDMLSGETKVHIFWRASNRAPFTYAGLGRAVAVREGPPSKSPGASKRRAPRSARSYSLRSGGGAHFRPPANNSWNYWRARPPSI